MSHPYTDHYPMPGMNIDERLCDHEKRIKEIEAKLGAADRKSQEAVASVIPMADGTASTAAPSVSVEKWCEISAYHTSEMRLCSSRACDLAAAVTEWWEDTKGPALLKHEQIERIASAFVCGERLPEKGG